MKHMQQVVRPQKIETVVGSVTCDICKREIKNGGYNIDEVELRYKEGFGCLEGGQGTCIEFDICSDCFKGKLIPFLKECGAEPVVSEWDW